MKKIIWVLMLQMLMTSSFARGPQEETVNDKFGEITGGAATIPCACILDKSKKPKFTGIGYNGYWWVCTGYDENGDCQGVVREEAINTNIFFE